MKTLFTRFYKIDKKIILYSRIFKHQCNIYSDCIVYKCMVDVLLFCYAFILKRKSDAIFSYSSRFNIFVCFLVKDYDLCSCFFI